MSKSSKSLVFSVNRFRRGERTTVGGFADRLKGIVFSYFLAKLTGRDFYIDWDYPFGIESLFSPNEVDWRLGELDVKSAKVVNILNNKGFDSVVDKISLGREGIEDVFGCAEVVKIHCNILDVECFRSIPGIESNFGDILSSRKSFFYELFHELFLYNAESEFSDELARFRELGGNGELVVGIQFRTGGGGRWKDPAMDDIDNVANLIQALDTYLSENEVIDYSVFLTSDDVEARSKIASSLKGCSKVLVFDFDPIHLDRSDDVSVQAGASQTCFEHYLLSQCNVILCGKGEFGVTAGFRGNKQVYRYFDIKKEN